MGKKNQDLATFKTDTSAAAMLGSSTSEDKHVPIRIRFADRDGTTSFVLKCSRYNAGGWTAKSGDPSGVVTRNDFCGLTDSGRVVVWSSGCEKSATVNFDYFISEEESNVKFDSSNMVRSAGKTDLNLVSDFTSGFGDSIGVDLHKSKKL